MQANYIWTQFQCNDVPIDRLEDVVPAYFSLMRNLSSSTTNRLDLKRIRGILQNLKSKHEDGLEDDPGDYILSDALFNFIVYPDMKQLAGLANEKALLDKLAEEDESFWRGIMKTFMDEENMVVLLAKPSKTKSKELEEKEEAFLANRRQQLGPEGLKEKVWSVCLFVCFFICLFVCLFLSIKSWLSLLLFTQAMILKDANEKNDGTRIPDEVLQQIPISSADSIVLPEVVTLRSRRLDPEAASKLPVNVAGINNFVNVLDLPYAIQISHYSSPTIHLRVTAHLSYLDDDLKR